MNPKLSRRALLSAALLSPLPAGAAPRTDPSLRPRVLLVIYNPWIPSEGGKRLTEVCGWKDPAALTQTYIQDLRECSGGYVQYELEGTQVVDGFPRKKDGFVYTPESYMECFRAGKGWHQPDAVDYKAMLKDLGVPKRIERREIDEVWIFAMPYAGLYESTMAGRDAFFCNSPPLTEIETARTFMVMGFNYERGVGEMLEDFGHRTESIMRRVYAASDGRGDSAWSRFSAYDKIAPGKAGCGNVHFAPNSRKDYEWGSKRPVMSTADDWLNYPRLTGKKRLMTAADWGAGDMRAHHKWWLSHLPRSPGRGKDRKLANWWKYAVEWSRYEESR